MAAPYRVVHYLNQFFFGLGGEEKASIEPTAKAGPVGPGGPLQEAFRGEAEIVKTATC
ncbi:MAG: glycine/sarcosine/betaine reductase selenoprotein B family protein, partial [Nitrospinota bacterium]|nr:glycine/sarcosine/betaine reductase selenoprotein B family protein [Nitrospinota bacterium]